FRPSIAQRARRALVRHASVWYLGVIAGATALLLMALDRYASHAGGTVSARVMIALLAVLPLGDLAIACVQYAALRLVGPARLPRLDFLAGVPDSARTMIVIPTMLTGAAGVDALLEHVEVLALGNLDPCVHFAVLS